MHVVMNRNVQEREMAGGNSRQRAIRRGLDKRIKEEVDAALSQRLGDTAKPPGGQESPESNFSNRLVSWTVVGGISVLAFGLAGTFATYHKPILTGVLYALGLLPLAAKLYVTEIGKLPRKKRVTRRVLTVVTTVVLLLFGAWAVRRLDVPPPPTTTDASVAEIYRWIKNKDVQEHWLAQFPLGYTIFDVNAVTGVVTPYDARQGLEDFEFDYRPVRIVENTSRRISIALPSVYKDGKPYLTGAEIGGDKATMQMYGAGYAFTKGDNMIWGTGQVLEYKGNQTYWIFGLSKTPAPPTNSR
jgi:hypothetical protein